MALHRAPLQQHTSSCNGDGELDSFVACVDDWSRRLSCVSKDFRQEVRNHSLSVGELLDAVACFRRAVELETHLTTSAAANNSRRCGNSCRMRSCPMRSLMSIEKKRFGNSSAPTLWRSWTSLLDTVKTPARCVTRPCPWLRWVGCASARKGGTVKSGERTFLARSFIEISSSMWRDAQNIQPISAQCGYGPFTCVYEE